MRVKVKIVVHKKRIISLDGKVTESDSEGDDFDINNQIDIMTGKERPCVRDMAKIPTQKEKKGSH